MYKYELTVRKENLEHLKNTLSKLECLTRAFEFPITEIFTGVVMHRVEFLCATDNCGTVEACLAASNVLLVESKKYKI